MKLATGYAQDVLGGAQYATWLYIYSFISGEFKEGWIPEDYYLGVVVPTIKSRYDQVSNLRAFNQSIFQSSSIPDILYSVNGLFLTVDGSRVTESNLKDVLFAKSDQAIFKKDDSFRGHDIKVFAKDDFSVESVRDIGSGVFQYFVDQHNVFKEFGSEAVATVRITTVVDGQGDVSVRTCYLRLGREGEFFVRSKSNIRIPVDIVTGELSENGYLSTWAPTKDHPDSQRRFQSIKIPMFQACVSTAVELHKKVPFAKCVGWDLTVDVDDNVRVMEWNGFLNATGFSEATQGPCFSDLGWEQLWH